jgi:TRAP-type C4-dicarboxylate transport system permease large subunit/TRAP-type C4-dicarboxylate transport system permease small subunit
MNARIPADGAAQMAQARPLARRIALVVDRLVEAVSVATLLAACLLAVVQVFFRYVLNNSLPWPEEVARLGFVWVVFLGMALAIHRDAHLRIDLVDRLSGALSATVSVGFRVVMVAAACAALAHHGLELVSRAMGATPALRIPISYLYGAVPAGAILGLGFLAAAPPRPLPVWAGLPLVAVGYALYLGFVGPLVPFIAQFDPAVVLVVVALSLVMAGVPIGFAMVFAVLAAFAGQPPLLLVTISQNMASTVNSFTLMAIPFFIAAAAVMNAGGITERLIGLAAQFVGHLRAGLGQVNILTSVMLGGVSGSSMADAGSTAKIMVPEMERGGYPRAFSCALTSASAVIANLIPPSLGLIIYGALASVSVGALFIATIVPGLLVALALSAALYIIALRSGYGAMAPKSSARDRWRAFLPALPALALPVLIVGGVRFGVFTATEAGAMAFVYAILCGTLIYRMLTDRPVLHGVPRGDAGHHRRDVRCRGGQPLRMGAGQPAGAPDRRGGMLSGMAGSPQMLMLLIILLLLFIGLFMEMIAAMVIMVPVFVPVIMAAGLDPIQFGVVIVLSLVIGALTPPLGMLIFTTARVGQISPSEVFRAVVPFVAALIAVLLLVAFVPAVSTGLLGLIGP